MHNNMVIVRYCTRHGYVYIDRERVRPVGPEITRHRVVGPSMMIIIISSRTGATLWPGGTAEKDTQIIPRGGRGDPPPTAAAYTYNM